MGGVCQHPQIEALRSQLAQWQGAWQHALEEPSSDKRAAVISSGCPTLDRILPSRGFRSGTLVEWLSLGPGSGAATFAFRTAVEALRMADGTCAKGQVSFLLAHDPPAGAAQKSRPSPGRAVVVLDPNGEFYPPAVIAQGIEPSRLIVVHPGSPADYAWALDQVLRCPAVAATVAWPDSARSTGRAPSRSEGRRNRTDIPARAGATNVLRNGKVDSRAFRRWQLAAEQGGGLGLLIRPVTVRGEPSWADVRLLVEPTIKRTVPIGAQHPPGRSGKWGPSPSLSRRLRIVLLRCRNGRGEQTVEVEIEDEPFAVP